ncbi:response regulator [candidate division KSB1 bacterium]|nr:response regulator [candidate division KSB1 bacterium]
MIKDVIHDEHILVVDDDESVLKLCTNSLRVHGFHVIACDDPTRVAELVIKHNTDLVISDIRMPGMNGLELLKKLKEVSPDIAVIIMTAFASMEVAINAVNDGAFSFIPKPFHLNELVVAVNNALERKQMTREIIRLKTLVNLFSVSEEIGNTLEISHLLKVLLKAVARETRSERAVVFYRDEETEEYYARCAVGDNELTNQRVRLPLEKTIVQQLFDERKPLVVDSRNESMNDSIPIVPCDAGAMLAVPLQTKQKHFGVLSLFKQNEVAGFSEADRDIAAILAAQASIALDNAELLLDYEILFLESMSSLVKALDERDPYTHGHSIRVGKISVAIGRQMGIPENELDDLQYAGLMHDIGKIGIRDEILLKPGPLSQEEYEIIKTHPERGYNILRPIQRLSNVAEAVHTHHEWYDGSGYPRGLQGNEIPMWGSIIAVADAYDTITTDRIYRGRKRHSDATAILRRYIGTQFHPDVVTALENIEIETLPLD